MISVKDWQDWHGSHTGLTGRSNDPTICLQAKRLLLPNDDDSWGLSYLKGWKNPATGKLVIPSVCALYGMASLRFAYGDDAPHVLSLPYNRGEKVGVRIAPADLQDAGSSLGILTSGAGKCLSFPDPGTIDIIDDGSGLDVHVIPVVDSDASNGAVLSTEGGKVDGSYILPSRHLLITPLGVNRLYYVPEDKPYLDNGQPNGRFVIARLSIPLLAHIVGVGCKTTVARRQKETLFFHLGRSKLPKMPSLTSRQLLVKWVARIQLTEQHDKAPLQCFKVHLPKEGSNKQNCVHESPVAQDANAEAIANELFEYAQQDANASQVKASVKYTVRAYYGTIGGLESRGGRCGILVRPEIEDNDDDSSSLSVGTPTDALTMVSRHADTIIRGWDDRVSTLVGHYEKLTNRLMIEVDGAHAARIAAIETIEALFNNRTEREVQARKQLRRERREDQFVGMFMRFVLPGLLAQKGDMDSAAAVLIGSMTEQQLTEIGDKLDANQVKPFMMLIQRAMDIKQTIDADNKKLEKDATAAEEMVNRAEGKDIGVKTKEPKVEPVAS